MHNTFIEVGAYALASGLATFVVHNLDVPFLSSARTVCGDKWDRWDKSVFVKKNLLENERPGFVSPGHSSVPGDMSGDKSFCTKGDSRQYLS